MSDQLHTITLTVVGESWKIRDLCNDIQEAIRVAQKNGRHGDVKIVQGPTVGTYVEATVVDGLSSMFGGLAP